MPERRKFDERIAAAPTVLRRHDVLAYRVEVCSEWTRSGAARGWRGRPGIVARPFEDPGCSENRSYERYAVRRRDRLLAVERDRVVNVSPVLDRVKMSSRNSWRSIGRASGYTETLRRNLRGNEVRATRGFGKPESVCRHLVVARRRLPS